MSGFLFTDNLLDADDVLITAETPSDLGADRLKDPRLSAAVRLTGATKEILIDFREDKIVKGLALSSEWFPTAYPLLETDRIIFTIDPHAGTPGAGASFAYDGPAGTLAHLGIQAWLSSTEITCGYASFIVDSVDPKDISRLWFETAPFSPARNVDFTFRDAPDDSTVAQKAETANIKYFDAGGQVRSWPLLWQKLTDAEARRFRQIRVDKGTFGQVVFGLFADPLKIPEFTLFGTFSQAPTLGFRQRSIAQFCSAQIEATN